jgi:hypothetical protein
MIEKLLVNMTKKGWRKGFDTLKPTTQAGLIGLHLDRLDTINEDLDDESLNFISDLVRALLEEDK